MSRIERTADKYQRSLPKLKRHEALAQREEEHWQCATCTGVALEDDQYCLHCKLYWEDISKWDDYDYA